MGQYRPFLVTDRPSGLRIIRGAQSSTVEARLGIMTHANVTPVVREFIDSFPSSAGFYDRNDGFEYDDDESEYTTPDGNLTDLGQRIRENTTLICDSGAFTKDGSPCDTYPALFDIYERMGVDYGLIMDELNDADSTRDEARQALNAYDDAGYSFSLVGVAQGESCDEYQECYQDLRDMGYDHIAIGGLLSKEGDRSGAFAQVNNSSFMKQVLSELRHSFPDDWLFALGCHHPGRHTFFEEMGLYGADYKGWLFKYNQQFTNPEKARAWRFRNLRGFIRQNLLPPSVGSSASHLLVFQASNTQSSAEDTLPALRHYCGQYVRSFRAWQASTEAATKLVDVVFVSGANGLVPGNQPIREPDNHPRIPSNRSHAFQERLRADLSKLFEYRRYEQVLIAGGKALRDAIERPLRTLSSRQSGATMDIRTTQGRFPTQLTQLREWLESLDKQGGTFATSWQA